MKGPNRKQKKNRDLCVGWRGPCETYGPDHGCQLSGGHGGPHQCPCGTKAPNYISKSMLARS